MWVNEAQISISGDTEEMGDEITYSTTVAVLGNV